MMPLACKFTPVVVEYQKPMVGTLENVELGSEYGFSWKG
jgi:hypothetical protein